MMVKSPLPKASRIMIIATIATMPPIPATICCCMSTGPSYKISDTSLTGLFNCSTLVNTNHTNLKKLILYQNLQTLKLSYVQQSA